MPDAPILDGSNTAKWRFNPLGLEIVEPLTFEEWSALFDTACQVRQSARWWIGDALVWGELRFGEAHAAVIDPPSAETMRVFRWVAQAFPFHKRHPRLSWSHHRAVRGVPDEAQRWELLCQAERESWSSRQLQSEVERRYARNIRSAPPIEADPEPGASETPQEAAERDEGPEGYGDTPEPVHRNDVPPLAPADGKIDIDELRRCQEAIRQIANGLALDKKEDQRAAGDLALKVFTALRRPLPDYVGNPLLNPEEADRYLVPPDWRISTTSGERVFGGRKWTVDLRGSGDRRAIAEGPYLAAALVDAAISAIIRDDTS